MSLQEHGRWAYLIDMAGTGWSGRLKLLYHARRPILVQRRVRLGDRLLSLTLTLSLALALTLSP